MQRILDHVAHSRVSFVPSTTQEFFALQLARKLNDVDHLRDYLTLAANYPTQFVLQAYHRAVKRAEGTSVDKFRGEVKWLSNQEDR
jgi:hypothetical protein